MFKVVSGSNGIGTSGSESPSFSRPTLGQYSTMICEQAGLRDLGQFCQAFRCDPGIHLAVRTRTRGSGYEFEQDPTRDDTLRGGWLVFEKLPGEVLRARAFKTLEGASAEFSAKLSLQVAGDVTMREFEAKPESHRGRHLQVTFEGRGQAGDFSMLMAPIATAIDAATRLFFR